MSPYRKPIKEEPLPDEYFWPEFPSHVDAEKTILGAILLDKEAYFKAAARPETDDFSLDSHRRIFLRMRELMRAGSTVDIVTLANELARRKEGRSREIEIVGGVAYLASLTEGLPLRPIIEDYVSIVREKARLRRLIGVCEQAIAKARDQAESAAAILKWMGENLKGIKEGR